jgi:alcohol dehydrogenase
MADRAVAQALVPEAPRRLVVRELPLPNLGDDDALVRVACGLCGTDHKQYTGELAGGFAFVPGHETVGTIDAIGPRAAQRWVRAAATGWPSAAHRMR